MTFCRPTLVLRPLALAASLGLASHAALAQSSAPQEPPQLSQAEFQSCLSELRSSKAFAAITPTTFSQYTEHLQPDATGFFKNPFAKDDDSNTDDTKTGIDGSMDDSDSK